MDQTAPAHELERRKQVRILLRKDLNIEPQKYEGRTYFVVKDPVSLRYYRLKENEHFLLQFLDGKHTLEEAQKAYEKRYRPDRLRLEDLEAFAYQLMQAGLAQSESPRAGKQLYERRNKRKRQEFMQKWTNILYIKIPVIDPDRILDKMVIYLGWLFSIWFFMIALGVMLGAIFLVLTHFETFRSKMPDYHEFFSFKSVFYLWAALGVVKVIHEFGHGLSCKKFGGEVHEMGFLFLCLSPCLYCNVSDAWTLPNKWHRIVISAAGIYVELVIAAIATFVWWYTPNHPFINNMALSLMVVCSVSTVVFNANPLLRYDGYYVVADWLEIPNLRERSNRYLKNVVCEHCLGIESPPEGYMELWRKILFVTYAIVSWCYKWFITFIILNFLWSFLKPYKLEVISNMLALAALASMIGWPLYRLGKNLHRRGRLPDMKRWRVVMSATVVVAVILFFFLVPIPISRIRGVGLVQAQPQASSQIYVRYPGRLVQLNVRAGDMVKEGEVLAKFRNEQLEADLDAARTEIENASKTIEQLQRRKASNDAQDVLVKIEVQLAQVKTQLTTAQKKVSTLQDSLQELILRADRPGILGKSPHKDDIGKYYDVTDREANAQPLFTIHEPGELRVCLPVETPAFNQLKNNLLADVIEANKQAAKKGESPRAPEEGNTQLTPLDITLRVHGMDSRTWKGEIRRLPESDPKGIPPELSSKMGGPIAVRAQPSPTGELIPQAQHYLVYIDILDPDPALVPGNMAQVKIYCKPETCASWVWRKVNDMFNLSLM